MTGRPGALLPAALAALLTAPVLAWAQAPGLPTVGYLQIYPSKNDTRFEQFKRTLEELGYVEGKTVAYEYRSAERDYARLDALALELVQRNVTMLFTDGGTRPIQAARAATRTIPTVFCTVGDPVGQGLVETLARPGGNITGVSVQHPDFAPKSLELLKSLLPSTRKVSVLTNITNDSLVPVVAQMRTAARALQLELHVVSVSTAAEFEPAFAEIARARPAGLVILRDSMMMSQITRLVFLAAKLRLPTMGGSAVVPEAGGLASYGPNNEDLLRRCAMLVGKVLAGGKPAEIPVEQPKKFDFVINLRVAKVLGVAVPEVARLRADRVIE